MRVMRDFAGWGLALFLIFMFVQATIHPLGDPPPGQVKLYDLPHQNIVFETMARNTGIALLEPTGRFVVAILELLACLLLLIPMFRRVGAILSAMILGGAVIAHLIPSVLGRAVPKSLEAGAATDGGQLFALAIAMLAASVLLIVVHPGRR